MLSHEDNPNRTASDSSLSLIALTLTRALGRENVRVVRVHPNEHDDSLASRYCSAVEICPDMYESETALTFHLLSLAAKYPGKRVLIPASDDCSLYIARAARDLSRNFTLINPSSRTMERIKDKKRQYELAREAGVPIPETWFPESEEQVAAIAATLNNFPYVIKPIEAQKWRLERYANIAEGQKAVAVHSREELLAEYRRIAAFDNRLMVQEIVSGPDEDLFTMLAYCSEDEQPMAHCVRRKLRQNPIDFGYCTATVSCHNPDVTEFGSRLLHAARFKGIVGIEFKRDSRSGEYKLIEINTRPVNTIGMAIGCGVNLPFIAYCDAIGVSPVIPDDWEDDVVWLRLNQDFVAATQLKRAGRSGYRDWLATLRGKRVHAVHARDDMAPFYRYYRGYIRRYVARLRPVRGVGRVWRGTRRRLQQATAWMW